MQKTISLSLAQQIHEKCEEKGIKLPESECAWIPNGEKWDCENIDFFETVDCEWGSCRKIVFGKTDDDYEITGIPAYDLPEGIQILPEQVPCIRKSLSGYSCEYMGELIIERCNKVWSFHYGESGKNYCFTAKSGSELVEAVWECILDLISNNLLTQPNN